MKRVSFDERICPKDLSSLAQITNLSASCSEEGVHNHVTSESAFFSEEMESFGTFGSVNDFPYKEICFVF